MSVNATSGGSTTVGVSVTSRTLSRTTSGTYRASTIHAMASSAYPSSVAYPTGTPVTTSLGQISHSGGYLDSRYFPDPPTGSTTITVTWGSSQAWAMFGVIEFASTLTSGLAGLFVRDSATASDATGGSGADAVASASVASSTSDRCGAIGLVTDAGSYGGNPLITGHTQRFARTPDSNNHCRGANFAGASGTATGTLTVVDNLGYSDLALSAVFFSIGEDSGGGPATTRGTPFGHKGTAFNGGRTFHGIIQ